MRITLTIADDILRELESLARTTNRSLADATEDVLRVGLAAIRERPRTVRAFRESPVDMGTPRVDLTKALARDAANQDEDHLRKLRPGK